VATVKGPFISLEARGSLSGMTASISVAGPVIRRKNAPVYRVRAGQSKIRSILGYSSRQWGSLTQAQRDAWIAYANDNPVQNKFGDPMTLSGINMFTKLNIVAVDKGGSGAFQTTPPSTEPASAVLVLTAATGVGIAGDVDLSWTEVGTGVAADFWEIRWAGPFQSPGKLEVYSKLANTSYVAGNVLLATIGGLDVGFWYWFAVRYVDQYGQTTNWHLAQATPFIGV